MTELPTYPGSRTPLRSATTPEKQVEDNSAGWDADPIVVKVNGVEREFFRIGALARALNRAPNTLRAWMTEGVIPPATYRTRGAGSRGSRRLWTREQIEGIRTIAIEEGVLIPDRHNSVLATDFPRRVAELFAQLRRQEGR